MAIPLVRPLLYNPGHGNSHCQAVAGDRFTQKGCSSTSENFDAQSLTTSATGDFFRDTVLYLSKPGRWVPRAERNLTCLERRDPLPCSVRLAGPTLVAAIGCTG